MKKRSIKELLILLSEQKEFFHDRECAGLCALALYLYYENEITENEHERLKIYIRDHRPKKGIYYYKYYSWNSWYWPIFSWEPRKAWLDSRIALKRP